jgi:hypothetical protein
VENSSISDSDNKYYVQSPASITKYGNIVIRVPSVKYNEAIAKIKSFAVKVESETNNARDVSAEYVDLEAQLKNMKAEEAQYQRIMNQAVKVSDVLEVASRLSDVRGRIERMQAQLNLLSKQVDMSTISVDLRAEADIESVGTSWKPLSVAKQALQDMLSSLTGYADGVIVFIISLPILLLSIVTWVLWLLAWALGLYIVWKLFKYLKKRFIDAI